MEQKDRYKVGADWNASLNCPRNNERVLAAGRRMLMQRHWLRSFGIEPLARSLLVGRGGHARQSLSLCLSSSEMRLMHLSAASSSSLTLSIPSFQSPDPPSGGCGSSGRSPSRSLGPSTNMKQSDIT